MNDSPKRPWFRFHLLTAFLMMVAASGIMLLNTSTYFAYHNFSEMYSTEAQDLYQLRVMICRGNDHKEVYGWPVVALTHYLGIRGFDWDRVGNFGGNVSDKGTSWNLTGLIVDISVAVAVVIAVALVSESLFRRREARKP